MTYEELSTYLESRPYVLWAMDDEGNVLLRHEHYDSEHEKLKIEPKALASLTPVKLDQLLTAGRNIEHITRVTGYFSRISGWNKGKKGELVERQRVLVG